MPVRNGRGYLSETIKSVLDQTHTHFRVVIVDNNSTDGSADLARSFGDPRLEIITHSHTLPLFDNLNFCLSRVQAPFFAILHADDRWRPAYLQTMVEALSAEPTADLAFCQVAPIGATGQPKTDVKYTLKNRLFLSSGGLIERDSIRGRALMLFNFVIAPSIFYRRRIVETLGSFRTDLSFLSDLEYLQRGLASGMKYLVVPQKLFEYRIHGTQETANLTKSLGKHHETLCFFSESVVVRGHPSGQRVARSAAEARTAMVVLWDHMLVHSPNAAEFRRALAEYLLESQILRRFALLWRMLRRGSRYNLVSRLLSALSLALLVLPILAWHFASMPRRTS